MPKLGSKEVLLGKIGERGSTEAERNRNNQENTDLLLYSVRNWIQEQLENHYSLSTILIAVAQLFVWLDANVDMNIIPGGISAVGETEQITRQTLKVSLYNSLVSLSPVVSTYRADLLIPYSHNLTAVFKILVEEYVTNKQSTKIVHSPN